MIFGLGSRPASCVYYTDTPIYQFVRGAVSFRVEGLEQNCSFLAFTDFRGFTAGNHKSYINLLLTAFNWAKTKGGYTKIFCTMSNSYNRDEIRKVLKKVGFKAVGEPYKNKRTSSIITWYQGDLDEMIATIKELKKK